MRQRIVPEEEVMMSIDDNELERRRTEAWLELRDSEMNQVEIGKIVCLSQPTVSRAIAIAESERDGPYTRDMNEAIDGYIERRDEIRAKMAREQQDAEKRADEERICREEEENWEKLWEWVEFDLPQMFQDSILRNYRLHNPGRTLTEEEELAVLVRYLVRRPGHTAPPVDITKYLELLTPTSTPVQPEPVAQPDELPRKTVAPPPQAASPPVRRSASPPRQTATYPVRSRSRTASGSGINIGKWALVCGALLTVVMIVVGGVMLASNETVRHWGPIVLGLLCILCSILCLIVLVRGDEPVKGARWIVILAAVATLSILMIDIMRLAFDPGDISFTDRYLR